ncbi:MAG: hypothetical protein ACI31M_02350 [Bacilli bacterium]
MKLNEMFKRQTFLIVGSIVLLLIVFAGISYAFFTKVLKSENDIIVKSGDLEITFNGSDTITGDFLPLSNDDGMVQSGYTFTVNNTGTLNAAYKVEVYADTSVEGTHIPHQYLMISLNGGEAVQLSTLTKTTTNEVEKENVYLLGNGTVEKKNSKENIIRLWIKEDAPTDIIGSKVALKVKVTSEVYKDLDNPVGNQS